MAKNPPANAGDAGLIPGSGRSPGGHGNPLEHLATHSSILVWRIMERGAWQVAAHRVAETQLT